MCDPVGGSSSDSDDETPAEGDAPKASGKSPEDKLVKVGEYSNLEPSTINSGQAFYYLPNRLVL